MVLKYEDCLRLYKTYYRIQQALAKGDLRKVQRGLYSDSKSESDLEVISRLYPYAVFTLNSAFYYHGLTDTIPQDYYLITDKNATKIKDDRVHQYFDNNNSLELGLEIKDYNGVPIKIFNRERMLIELIRNKNKFSFDYYKEIISSYRKILYELDTEAIQDYVIQLPKTRLVMETIQLEVF